MNTPQSPGDRLVYVRPVLVAELPQDVQDQAEGLDTLYALHSADGEQLALVKNRHMAFQLALQNDLAPVNVH
ncbi:DUF1150 family protein [Falsirhodobacter sp. 1013]|uniref:DUF1150 family protein n=1 Tax=Falsirhodobacter sp. 1013 TaxID=3417566 RepID=UPI003EB71EE6